MILLRHCVTEAIQLNGQSFSVTTNLGDCLRQLPLDPKYGSMRLWVVAICINQRDTDERNEQVQRMRDIYWSAESVIAWLGPGTHFSRIGMQRLQNVSLDEVKSMEFSTEQDGMERRNHIWSRILAGDGEQGLQDIVLRPYWHRTWIVQEIILGKRVRLVCGDDEVAFEWLLASQLFLASSLPRNVLSNFSKEHQESIVRLATNSNIGCTRVSLFGTPQDLLLERLSKFSSFQCSDDRNKVYALLGLCHDAQHIVPDYKNPTANVYGGVVDAHIKTYDNLHFLKYAEYNGERGSSYPSWFPDWRSPLARKYIGLDPSAENLFQASKGLSLSSCPWSLGRNTEKIHLTGACLDAITTLSGPFDLTGLTINELVNTALDCMHLIYQSLAQQGTIDPRLNPINMDDSHMPNHPLNDNELLWIALSTNPGSRLRRNFDSGEYVTVPVHVVVPRR
ncbi:HET-domain-containing protein [Apiospora aurea]|uniref:HET-domain-containing protein n=1 Tax=Apiospora aurea TaxID=335848 RepID=A0ABR1QNX9_9PEZI